MDSSADPKLPDPSTSPSTCRLEQPEPDPIVEVQDLTVQYAGQTILEGVNFQVHPREVLVIAGASGSGKSTLLRHMLGLEASTRGKVLIEGENLAAAAIDDRQRILRRIGVAFQSGALFGSMTVLENVELPLRTYTQLSRRMIAMVALTKLQLVGLAEQAQKKPAELSGGMQRRAGIARALALDPAILFLDEPSAGLDPFTSAELDQLILALQKLLNMTFIIVSHQLPSIFTIADRVLLLSTEKKTIVAEGDPTELRDSSPDPWVRAFFSRQPLEHHSHSEDSSKSAPSRNGGARPLANHRGKP